MKDPEFIDIHAAPSEGPEEMPKPEGHENDPEPAFSGFRPNIAIIILISIIVLIALVLVLTKSATKNLESITVERERTIIVEVPVNISIESYAKINDSGYEEKVSILGFLKQTDVKREDEGIYTMRYITDSYNNSVKLNFDYHMRDYYAGLFIPNDVTSLSYRVNGTLKYYLGEFNIEVKSIILEDRERINETKIIRENITTTRNAIKDEKGFFS